MTVGHDNILLAPCIAETLGSGRSMAKGSRFNRNHFRLFERDQKKTQSNLLEGLVAAAANCIAVVAQLI